MLLKGKKAVVFGVASTRSIAFGIAQALRKHGCDVILNYQNEKLSERVIKLGQSIGAIAAYPCDMGSDDEILAFFKKVDTHWKKFDAIIHAVAYAPADQIGGSFVDNVSREGFRIAHEVSSYSLAAVSQAAKSRLNVGGSITTMTYIASQRVIPNYNTMSLAKASLEANTRYLAYSLGSLGIRVNAISAGPIKTLAAAGIKGIRDMIHQSKKITPLKQETTTEQVGNVACFLVSDMSNGITGDIIHVDQGFHIMGMPSPQENES